ncbi:hypothetical protein [Metallibacterium sp.]|uniref:hypothetical protein n=1 Tax=Metallibacterium sp. TaxID=2940281 RepID=UPI002609FEF3|nr:hypothetical protein [Metallibacterium sp.]
MDLMANMTFRLRLDENAGAGYLAGIYRVIFDDPRRQTTIAVLIQPDEGQLRACHGGRKRKVVDQLKRPRKKQPQRLVGELIWMDRGLLHRLHDEKLLMPIELEREAAPVLRVRSEEEYKRRVLAMAGFLDLKHLQDSIVAHGGLGDLVRQAMASASASSVFIYRQWSRLCRYGLDERSLIPRRDRCGAPGVTRPCDPSTSGKARKKSGRKTVAQTVARAYGQEIDSGQPGMSTKWAAAIRAADRQIPLPKPDWPRRCRLITQSAFCSKAVEKDGKFELVLPGKGTYPNDRQIRRALQALNSSLARVIERTTKRHFQMARRGLVARNWQGVAGPGHMSAIDSTVGDLYLRSSLNRAWIVGRPIVYIIVDVWSTAITGFYVCLTGPSWNTAKISIFNAGADPTLVADLWGYHPILGLDPAPTLSYSLMCDRGEYLSQGHRATAFKLIPLTSYAPPYRGDLKGSVEVLHRIVKDAQFMFIPGAMDFRRQELELRKVNPADCVLTVREYVHYLYELFSMYNLTADRTHRLDALMTAEGVYPSPAGLWHWGHDAGIGYRRQALQSDLISELLPSEKAWVRRDAVRFGGCDYMSNEVKEAQWTAIARNLGGWELPIHYYPGSVSQIWTPNVGGAGLLSLQISDQSRASPELTWDEWSDCLAIEAMKRPDREHERMLKSLSGYDRIGQLFAGAKQQTADAIDRATGKAPTMSEARAIETAATAHPSRSESKVTEEVRDEAMQAHEAMMAALLHPASSDEDAYA